MPELRQCAWCWLVKDTAGKYSLQPGFKINSATHGICPTCKATLLAEITHHSAPLVAA